MEINFYVGWSHSDVYYPDYFPGCPILISALPDNRVTLKRFIVKPEKLIIDCGSVFYVKQQRRPALKEVLDIQKSIANDCSDSTEITFVHFDEPMFNKTSLSDKYFALERTLFNAYEYINVFEGKNGNHSCMGVIQGYDRASVQFSAFELIRMGYRKFGIGSLLSKHYTEQLRLIQDAVDIVGAENLHVFGVTGITQISSMIEMGIHSFDSTRPTMAAAYFQVFYCDPFRTYYIADSRAKPTSPSRISAPLSCQCPVCLLNPADILIPSPREFMKLRSVHNYYHLMQTINELKYKR